MSDYATMLAQLEALKSARRAGLKRIKWGENEVEYRSDAELMAAISQLEAEVLGGAGVRNVIIRSTKGW